MGVTNRLRVLCYKTRRTQPRSSDSCTTAKMPTESLQNAQDTAVDSDEDAERAITMAQSQDM